MTFYTKTVVKVTIKPFLPILILVTNYPLLGLHELTQCAKFEDNRSNSSRVIS